MILRLFLVLSFLTLIACDSDRDMNTPPVEVENRPTESEPYPSVDTTSRITQAGSRLSYVGSGACGNCHGEQSADWQGSHHDLAMAFADETSVLGDFDNATFEYFGVQSRFFRKDGDFYVETDGPDGELTNYKIAYTFGVYPLQQYLITFPGGKLQALNIVWDSRSREAGGQRWFHLYPNEQIDHSDELHWTGINHNWNFMCADCHSTNLKKNYDLSTLTYHTSWSEINVGCEACHGPASGHLAWANGDKQEVPNSGFPIAYTERKGAMWQLDPTTGNSTREPQQHTELEIESCARCHSRRLGTSSDVSPSDDFLDHFQLSLLEEGLYHSDGQINGEVYVYGSFLQSKMYQAGVTCSDCHNPHSLKLRAEGNVLCAQCHLKTKYDNEEHHFHSPDMAGSQCVDCHMPSKNYMQVDGRRDHSFRIPRPDLSVELGTPNACTRCHTDRTNQWAANALTARNRQLTGSEYARAIHAGRRGLADAESLLMAVVEDKSQPAIVRASAVAMLPAYLSQDSASALQEVAQGGDPLLKYALARELQSIAEQYRPAFAVPLLYGKDATTRALAANSIAGIPLSGLPVGVREKFETSLAAYEKSERFNADRPESLSNLAGLYARQGRFEKAEEFYHRAMELAPYFAPAYINLADLYVQAGDEEQGRTVLHEALSVLRDKGPVHHALGLSLVRSGDRDAALGHLRTAAQWDQAPARYRYVYGVALNSLGQPKGAIEVLEQAHKDFPANRDIVSALSAFYRNNGDLEKAEYYRRMLEEGAISSKPEN